jgi:hypothetical protein
MKLRNLIIWMACGLVLTGCKTDDEFDGPSLNDLYGAFSVVAPLETSADTVDFSAGETVNFTASFSKNVSWKLEIKGLQSGAVKEITGFSNLLDANNALWTGTTTKLPFFKVEDCAVQLTFEAESDTLSDTLFVSGTRTYPGLLLGDFEGTANPGWTSFVQSGADMSFGIQTNSAGAAQGNGYFDIGGAVDWDYLIAYLYMPATAYGSPTFNLSSNPEEVYFNTLLFKPESLNNGIMLFQFPEDDNGDGVFTVANEDMYAIEVQMNQNNWSQLSVKYSELQSLVNGQPAAPNGNGVREPNKLTQVNILFLANPASGYANARLDYMIFTEGEALQP